MRYLIILLTGLLLTGCSDIGKLIYTPQRVSIQIKDASLAESTATVLIRRLEEVSASPFSSVEYRVDDNTIHLDIFGGLPDETTLTKLLVTPGKLQFKTESGLVLVTNEHIETATAYMSNDNQPAIILSLNPAGTDRVSRWSSDNIGKTMQILYDDTVLISARVAEPLGKRFQVAGDFTSQELELVAIFFHSGALPTQTTWLR